MVKKSIKIELSSGLEARPAAMLVQVASQYDSKIYLEADSKRVNAKTFIVRYKQAKEAAVNGRSLFKF